MSNLVSKTIGPYQMILKIRETHTNEIYKAYDTIHARFVTVQVILPDQSWPEMLFSRLKAHCNKLSSLNHPHIGRLIDCDIYQNYLCLVYDFVPSMVFHRRFGRKMPWKDAVQFVLPAAQALAFAHTQGVAHGHIQPSSVLLNEEKAPALFDFGVEKIVFEEVSKNTPGSWLGSEVSSYTAPEQAIAGPGGRIDPRADVYSFGMLLYELILGQRAFQADTPFQELVEQYTHPERIDKELKTISPPALQGILTKAMAVRPEQRFQNMEHFSMLLAKLALGHAVPPQLIRDANWQPATANRWVLWSLAGVFAMVILIILFYQDTCQTYPIPGICEVLVSATPQVSITPTIIKSPNGTPVKKTEVAPVSATEPVLPENFTETPTVVFVDFPFLANTPVPSTRSQITAGSASQMIALTRLGIGRLNAIALSPAGPYVALAAETGLYIVDYQQQQIVHYINTNDEVISVSYSPDGNDIAAGEKMGLVRIWDQQTGAAHTVYRGHGFALVKKVIYSPDGSQLASLSDDRTAIIWEIRSSDQPQKILLHENPVIAGAFSPDGKRLLTVSGKDVVQWDTATSERLQTISPGMTVNAVAYSVDGASIFLGGTAGLVMLDAASLEVVDTFGRQKNPIVDIDISLNGLIGSVDASGQVAVWNSAGENLLPPVDGSKPAVLPGSHVRFTPGEEGLLAASSEGSMRIWPDIDPQTQPEWMEFSEFVTELRFSPDGRFLLAETADERIKVWDFPRAMLLDVIEGKLPRGNIFTSDSKDVVLLNRNRNELQLYDIDNLKVVDVLDGPDSMVTVSINANNNLIVAGSSTSMRVWSRVTRREIKTQTIFGLQTCRGVEDSLSEAIAFKTEFQLADFDGSPTKIFCAVSDIDWNVVKIFDYMANGNYIATSLENTVSVWDYTSIKSIGKKTIQFPAQVTQIAFSANGNLIAVALADQTIHIVDWNRQDPSDVRTPIQFDGDIQELEFSPDGNFLVSASANGIVLIWGVQ